MSHVRFDIDRTHSVDDSFKKRQQEERQKERDTDIVTQRDTDRQTE